MWKIFGTPDKKENLKSSHSGISDCYSNNTNLSYRKADVSSLDNDQGRLFPSLSPFSPPFSLPLSLPLSVSEDISKPLNLNSNKYSILNVSSISLRNHITTATVTIPQDMNLDRNSTSSVSIISDTLTSNEWTINSSKKRKKQNTIPENGHEPVKKVPRKKVSKKKIQDEDFDTFY